LEFRLVEKNDAILGMSENKIEDYIYDLAFARAEGLNGTRLRAIPIHQRLISEISLDKLLWGQELTESLLEGGKGVGPVERHRSLAVGTKLFCDSCYCFILTSYLAEKRMKRVLKP
jgi:hypothetical protein